jgi:cytochrome c5
MSTATCPAGHESTTTDYCDTCGAPIGAATTAETPTTGPAAPEAEAPAAATCPGCGDSVVGRFCESCGYDVESGTPAAPPPITLVLSTDRAHWERMVGSGEPAFPTVGPSLNFELTGDRAVLGRVRSGAPVDVDLALTGAAADPAISHNQCVFERDGGQWTVRDADSSNGTWINDATEPLAAGAMHRLVHGDRILIGAWTCLTVQAERLSPSSSAPSSSAPSSSAPSSSAPPSSAPSSSAPPPSAPSPDPSGPPDPAESQPS